MYAVMGITGQVGGAVARTLLAGGHAVRGVVRDPARAAVWRDRGVTLATADQADPAALAAALRGVAGAFVMLPPMFAPSPDFAEARGLVAALRQAVADAAVPRVVALSSIGAQHDHGLGVITPLHLLEAALASLPVPVALLRPGWFMENTTWDVPAAHDRGVLESYLQPLERPVPMVATDDVGRVAAETLTVPWSGRRVIELEGPRLYAPTDVAAALSSLVRRPVRVLAVPRAEWAERFAAAGTPAGAVPLRLEMLDGFNAGHIEFADGPTVVRGRVTLDDAVAAFAAK